MPDNPPEGYTRITPYLLYEDAAAAIDFLTSAFGFTERMRTQQSADRMVMTIPAKHRISVPLSALVAAALLMSATLGAAAAQAAQTKACGTVLHGKDRFFGIKATGVSCATARKMTGQWIVNLKKQTRGCKTYKLCHVRDFTCTVLNPQGDYLDDCRRPGARVTWRLGLPIGDCGYTHSCNSSRPTGDEAFRV